MAGLITTMRPDVLCFLGRLQKWTNSKTLMDEVRPGTRFGPKDDQYEIGEDKPGQFHFFAYFCSRTGPRDPSRCVGIAEISLGAHSKSTLVAFLSKKLTFRRKPGLQALLIRFSGLWLINISP